MNVSPMNFSSSSAVWQLAERVRRATVPARVWPWLINGSSLTQRLMAVCDQPFSVRVLSQAWQRPYADEMHALDQRSLGSAWVRQVQLRSGDRPWVFARTVIPRASLIGPNRRLTRLGSRPLGAALFADPTLERCAVEIARLVPGNELFQLAVQGISTIPTEIWGRRSVFRVHGQPVLVSEIFLPGIPEAPT